MSVDSNAFLCITAVGSNKPTYYYIIFFFRLIALHNQNENLKRAKKPSSMQYDYSKNGTHARVLPNPCLRIGTSRMKKDRQENASRK